MLALLKCGGYYNPTDESQGSRREKDRTGLADPDFSVIAEAKP